MRLLTLDEASARLGAVSVRVLRACIARGTLPAVKVGRAWLVTEADLARTFTPATRPSAPRRQQTPTERSIAQLRAAGFVVPR